MRVLHAIWSLEMGGAETLLVDLLNRQARTGRVGLLIANDLVDERVLGLLAPEVAVLRVGRPPGSRNPWYLYRMHRATRAFRPDILHCHNPSLLKAMPSAGFRSVLTVHDTALDLPSTVARYDLVTAISRAVQADVQRRAGVNALVIPNGIDFAAISARTWPRRGPIVRAVQVSRLVSGKKGQDILVSALAELAGGPGGSPLHVDFIGDGPDAAALVAQALAMGVADRCRFLGSRDRGAVYRSLPEYDLLVQPSRFEGFGLTVLEGVAAGLPVVAADLEGPQEILGRLETRYLFQPGNARDCAAKLAMVMGDMSAGGFGARMAANRAVLQEQFDIEAAAASYLDAYARLLAGGRRSA